MERFSYKGGCGVTHNEVFKKRVTWVLNEWFQITM